MNVDTLYSGPCKTEAWPLYRARARPLWANLTVSLMPRPTLNKRKNKWTKFMSKCSPQKKHQGEYFFQLVFVNFYKELNLIKYINPNQIELI